ncbi:MAG: metallophosphoesterase [Eubacteriales bacterium]
MKFKTFLKKHKYFLLIFLFLMILAFDVRLKTVVYTLESDKINTPIRICLVTDLHGCTYGDNQEKLIREIDKMEPDIILLGGDIFDDVHPWENSEIFLGEITHYTSYYVTGNHEYWSHQASEILGIIQSYGVQIIDGEHQLLEIKGEMLNLCGVSDPDGEKYVENQDSTFTQLVQLEEQIDTEFYSILLTHRPELVDTYLNYSYDLALAGHAHGGQWRIPFLLNGLYAPNQGIFPQYAGGFYGFEDMNLIVSRGLSRENQIIPRIFNRPELVFIDLT